MSGINFTPVASDTAKNMNEAVKYILNLNISPDDKIRRLSTTFNLVGSDFYTQMFDANSQVFDSAAIGTTDYNEMAGQIDRLARKIVQNDNLGRNVAKLVTDFYDSALGQAQDRAFRNAISLDRHPTLTRSIVGETCKWCFSKAGTHVNPEPEMFARHENCDCLFTVSGYKSRNGVLNNYAKRTTGRAVRVTNNPSFTARITQNDFRADVFRDNMPGIGNVDVEKSRFNRTNDISLAKYLKKNYGGNYIVMSDISPKGIKTPDILLEDYAVFELKEISSIASVDSQTHKALKQLENKNLIFRGINTDSVRRVIVLDAKNSTLNIHDIKDAVKHRISRSSNDFINVDYVMVQNLDGKEWIFHV